MAVVFTGTFTLAALLHRDTVVALLLCGVAMTTLVLSVIGANVRSPLRRRGASGHGGDQRQLGAAPTERPPAP